LTANTTYTPYGLAVEGAEQSRYSYEGQEFDSVTSDYDFHFRKYKADWGIFLQPDTLLPNVFDPQQLNRYAFERGNPYKYVDPTGHDFGVALGILTIGIIISFILTVRENDKGNVEGANKAANEGLYSATLGLITLGMSTLWTIATEVTMRLGIKNKESKEDEELGIGKIKPTQEDQANQQANQNPPEPEKEPETKRTYVKKGGGGWFPTKEEWGDLKDMATNANSDEKAGDLIKKWRKKSKKKKK